MKVYKERQYLVFELDDNKIVKYDFANNTSIGLNGKIVKGLQRQLKDITIGEIIDSCEDKNYAEFLKFLGRMHAYRNIRNPGTILSKIPLYSNYEQIFSAGIKEKQIINDIKCTINDIPKSLIKCAKEHENFKLSKDLIKYWKEDVDSHVIGMNLEYFSLNESDISLIYLEEKYCGDWRNDSYKSIFNILIKEYNYSAKSLLLYLDYLKTYEALENVRDILIEVYDYAKMMIQISDKYDKYPKNFLTTHKIACRNYDRLKTEFSEANFKKRINKEYECTIGDYVFIYPGSTQDIKDEAVQQNNCVASYIDSVIDGYCHILFMRKKTDKSKSLVTIEVNPMTNKIIQAKGRFNRDTTDEENNAIEQWNKRFMKIKEIAA